MNFLNTFRGRLLVVLAILLVGTLSLQYYLNLRSERQNAELREQQEKAIVAGISLGFASMSSSDRLTELRDKQPFYREHADRIANILVINDEWEINDSLIPDLVPERDEDGDLKRKKLNELTDLPQIQDAEHLGADRARFPTAALNGSNAGDGETHAIPVETDEGRWYLLVVLKSEKGGAERRAAQTLVYPLSLLLVSTFFTVFLVWRFTRPIANLSDAARRVAEGDLSVRVDHAHRSDEMGQLAARFNEMTTKLETTRELETKLQQAEKSAVVGRLASAIAHEIRNPLNYINLTLDHLRAKFAPEDNGKRETFERLTAQLKTEVGRINNQITDFLRYSRPIKLNLQPTDIRNVVEDSMRIVEAQAEEQGIVISIVERGIVSGVLGDVETLRSVFNNLFLNAVQAMKDGGKLTTTISTDGDFVCIEVADTGSGIEMENLNNIFEPYFSTKETGTGLGLAIAKKIIEDHRGAIEVQSTPNEGTIFTVKLQAAK
ncbi:MAG TPA: ATP-binding protein [Pyrinomonadaceae bacterium]|nr:ATP-binding protein [Pyrinomonadaceae bacterium]